MLEARSNLVLAATMAAAAVLGGCSRDADTAANAPPPAEAPPMAEPAPANAMASPFMQTEEKMHAAMMSAVGDSAERTWAAKMVAHHQGAVDMARTVLSQAPDSEVKRMAQMTIDKQGREIAELQTWLGGHPGAGSAKVTPFTADEQKMSQAMMAAGGATLEQSWARKMIPHHQGAIDMSQTVLPQATDAQVRKMAEKTAADQRKDIDELERWLAAHPA